EISWHSALMPMSKAITCTRKQSYFHHITLLEHLEETCMANWLRFLKTINMIAMYIILIKQDIARLQGQTLNCVCGRGILMRYISLVSSPIFVSCIRQSMRIIKVTISSSIKGALQVSTPTDINGHWIISKTF